MKTRTFRTIRPIVTPGQVRVGITSLSGIMTSTVKIVS